MNRSLAPVAMIAAAALTTGSPGAYTIVDLGSLGGDMSFAHAVDDSGRAAGSSVIGALTAHHAFVSTGGLVVDLGVLPGKTQSQAFGLDGTGRVVGVSAILGDASPRAFRWEAGVLSDLGLFQARASNAAGTIIVGHRVVTDANGARFTHACMWQGGAITDLGTLGGDDSLALDINSAGVVVGSSYTAANSANHACAWIGGVPVDLGTLAGQFSQAAAINSAGTVVGVSSTASGGRHAFMFTTAASGVVLTRTDLGALPGANESAARDMNDAGAVVGVSGGVGFLWQGGGLTDINTLLPPNSGWQLGPASSISNSGRIVGWGMHDGLARAFMLTPACPGDANGDGMVGLGDIAVLITNWALAVPPAPAAADLDGSGDIGLGDVAAVITNWNATCP